MYFSTCLDKKNVVFRHFIIIIVVRVSSTGGGLGLNLPPPDTLIFHPQKILNTSVVLELNLTGP